MSKIRKGMAILCFLMPFSAFTQTNDVPNYPKDYFRNPLDIPIFLAGNFGECRSGHFHSGLDIKTQGKENLAVYAAGDGYVSRIKTEKGGFGHAIYITHPNGFTTLYAHLNDFMPFLQQYLRKTQYERKRWDLDQSFPPEKFPVRKGQQIAWSGNTSGSSAPHLHFEIRDNKTEHPLNPQLFGLKVVDNIPPDPAELVFYSGNVYDRNLVSYTLGKKGGSYKALKASNSNYRIQGDTIEVPAGFVGVGINADDHMEGSTNTITFFTAKLLMDDSLQAMVTLNDIGYDISRYIHAYTDFYTRQVFHKWIQCLFRVPGNRLRSIYGNLNEQDGRLSLEAGSIHKVNVILTDNNENVTNIELYIKAKAIENKEGGQEGCVPFAAGKTNDYSDPGISFTLDERQLYDDICLSVSNSAGAGSDYWSDIYRVHYPYIPLHHYFSLKLKPNKPIPFNLRDKVVMLYTDGKDEDGRDATSADQGWYKANVRNFGDYWLAIDTVGPVIHSLQKEGAVLSKAKKVIFNIKDAMTSVKTFDCQLDGKWICMEQHGSTFFYEFDEHCAKGSHEMEVVAADENGNESRFKLKFSR
jgi:hypothetical protein